MKRSDKIILSKIISEALIISGMVQDLNEESFLADEKTKRAVCMTLINIGELAKHLSEECKSGTKNIPWKKISGLRDVTAHGYQTLSMPDIWVNATNRVPELITHINAVLAGQAPHG
jgi:uncharacterized protein with HEPN domain